MSPMMSTLHLANVGRHDGHRFPCEGKVSEVCEFITEFHVQSRRKELKRGAQVEGAARIGVILHSECIQCVRPYTTSHIGRITEMLRSAMNFHSAPAWRNVSPCNGPDSWLNWLSDHYSLPLPSTLKPTFDARAVMCSTEHLGATLLCIPPQAHAVEEKDLICRRTLQIS